jgi:ABC-type polysaccharide/polyol phosphate export permease
LSLVRPLLASIWMGWQRDVGWGNPVLAILARAVAPAAGALTAAIVYWFGSSSAGLFDPSRLAYVVIGASLYGQIALYAYVPTAAIAEGKNSYVYPQVYMTPSSSVPYLAGRCIASFLESIPVVVISLACSAFVATEFFHSHLPLIVSPLSIALALLAMVLVFPSALGVGYLLGSYAIFASKFEWAVPSYIAGTLMILSEALYPASVLPWPLSLVAESLPFTYFMRATRDVLLYGSFQSYVSDAAVAFLLGVPIVILGLLAFRSGEKKGRLNGFIDKKSM